MKQHLSQALDRADLAKLYQNYAPRLLDNVCRHVSSFQDAEDILTEVFVAALENAQFASLSESAQQRWLWRVAHNKVIDTYRRAQRQPYLPLKNVEEQVVEDAAFNPEQMSIRQEEDDYLAAQIKQLPPLQQQVLYMRFGEHLRCAQIATLIGKREGSVRSMLSRAMNLLRRQCQDHEEGGHHHG